MIMVEFIGAVDPTDPYAIPKGLCGLIHKDQWNSEKLQEEYLRANWKLKELNQGL